MVDRVGDNNNAQNLGVDGDFDEFEEEQEERTRKSGGGGRNDLRICLYGRCPRCARDVGGLFTGRLPPRSYALRLLERGGDCAVCAGAVTEPRQQSDRAVRLEGSCEHGRGEYSILYHQLESEFVCLRRFDWLRGRGAEFAGRVERAFDCVRAVEATHDRPIECPRQFLDRGNGAQVPLEPTRHADRRRAGQYHDHDDVHAVDVFLLLLPGTV